MVIHGRACCGTSANGPTSVSNLVTFPGDVSQREAVSVQAGFSNDNHEL